MIAGVAVLLAAQSGSFSMLRRTKFPSNNARAS
jgi:hypothetical protein